MIRLILLLLIAILFLVLTLPVQGILILIGRSRPEVRQRVSQKMVQWIFRVLLFAGGVHLDKKGLEQLPADRGVLYTGNHRSIFDILAMYAYLPGPTVIVSKDSLKKIPLLHLWMRSVGCLFLDRSDIKAGLRMIQDGCEKIKAGTSVLIYPEGTRNTGSSELPLLEFHEGSFRMAVKTGCPVIPVAVTNTAEIFEEHKPFVRSQHVSLVYGAPIDTTVLSRDEKKRLGAYTREVISGLLEECSA